MGLHSLSDQTRFMTKIETSEKAVDPQTTEDLKILSQNICTISPTQGTFLHNTNVAYASDDVKTTNFPLSLTIDASVFTDQLKPAVRLAEERKKTLKASNLEEKRRGIVKVQELGRDTNDKRTPEANSACTPEICEKGKIKKETCTNISAKKELLPCDKEISPAKLSEMINKEINNSIKEINNSIKDAVQTIVKQCSMVPRMQEEKKAIVPCSKKPERKSRVYRSRVAEEIAHRKKLLNAYTNRQRACHASQQFNSLSVYGNLYPYSKTHENAILLPVKNKVNNKTQSKKHLEPVNMYKPPVTTDNRRMTGNVNIYICSEANKNGQSKLRSYTNTSSDAITERSNSRCASSASSCKLINSIQEKRKKLQQSPNFIHEKRDRNSDSSENNIICDDRTLRRICRNEPSESNKEQTGIKADDDDAVCKNTISTADSRCCEDGSFSSTDLQQESSDSAVPCSSFNVYNNSRRPQSWTAIYPSETRATLNDSDASLSNALCTNVEQRNYRKNNRSNVYKNNKNNNEYALCDAIDGSRWLPKSIYTDCVTYAKIPKECSASSCKYRYGRPQNWVLNRNNIWKKQIGYKLSQQPPESCQREYVTRQWSTCSCIAEEEEDHCTNVEKKLPKKVCDDAKCPEKAFVYETASSKLAEGATACETSFGFVSEEHLEKTRVCKSIVEDHCANVEKKLPENVCDDAKCPEKIFISRISSCKLNENITVCETSLDVAAGERFEETQAHKCTFEDSMECPRSATVCATTFENSKEPPKVMRVRELVAEELPRDIAVRGTMFGEPKGPAEEVAVCKAAPPDSKEAPEETICKKIPYSNFVNQDNVKRVFFNDAKDKLVEENTSSSNLNNQEENVRNAKGVVQPDNKYDNVARNNFTDPKFVKDVKQEKETVSNDQSEVPTTEESTRNSEPLSKNIYSITLPHAEFYHRLNRNAKAISKTLSDQQRMIKMQSSSNRQIRSYSQQTGKILKNPETQDLASSNNNKSEEKTQEKLQDKKETQDISREIQSTERKTRDSLLRRSLKKMIDAIRRDKTLKDRIKAEKTKSEKIIDDIEKDIGKSKIISKTGEKISDEKSQPEISKKLTTRTKSPFQKREKTGMTVSSVKPKPTAPVTDNIIPEKHEKIDITMDRTKPKLLRIIAAKKLHLPSTVIAADSKLQESEIESVPAKIIVNEHVDQEEIPKEKVSPQEPIPTEITEKIKAEELVKPEISVSEIKDTPQDIVDILKDDVSKADEKKVSPDIVDETTKIYMPYPQEKIKEEIQKSIPCKCDFFSEECTKPYVTCPQKKLEDESQKIPSCKCKLPFDLLTNDCSCLITKCIKYNSIPENYPCKNNELKQKEDYCARCHSLIAQCTCTSAQYLKSCLKIDKPKFRSISSSKISSRIYTDCCGIKEECKCKRTAFRCQPHEECKCRWCATHTCPQMVDKCKYKLANCTNCCRSRDRCYYTTSALACHIIKKGCSRQKAMICLYCDNPQDKCICRAPIGKCTRSELPSDICNCHDCDREQISRRPDENQTIRVTSWKPRKEIRRYFARDFEDLWSDSIEECRCREKPKRQPAEELPYQRLNIFSDVMNELQRKMSESVCCTRCWKNPCCCGLRVDQDEKKEEKRAEDCLRCPEIDKSSKRKSHRSKSPNNCRCISSPRDELTNIVQNSTPIRRIGCVCKLPCKCRKSKPLRDYKRPLAKCYYCKSLPCTCLANAIVLDFASNKTICENCAFP